MWKCKSGFKVVLSYENNVLKVFLNARWNFRSISGRFADRDIFDILGYRRSDRWSAWSHWSIYENLKLTVYWCDWIISKKTPNWWFYCFKLNVQTSNLKLNRNIEHTKLRTFAIRWFNFGFFGIQNIMILSMIRPGVVEIPQQIQENRGNRDLDVSA